MASPKYHGGESLLYIKGRAQAQAGTSERIQSEHDPKVGHVWRMESGEGRGKKGEELLTIEVA